MAYETGTPTSPVDLLAKIDTFLTANGWTEDKTTGSELHVHKGSIYAHLFAAVAQGPWDSQADSAGYGLMLYLSDSFNTLQPWNLQPTNPPIGIGGSSVVGVGMNLSAGPFLNYYFFTDSTNDNVVIVVEKSPGVYVYLAWGNSLKKNGTWTGGAYFLGSSSGFYAGDRALSGPAFTSTSNCPGAHNDPDASAGAFVRCDSDSFTGKWIPISDVTSGSAGATGRSGASSVFGTSVPPASIPAYARALYIPGAAAQYFQFMTSVLDGRVNLLPILWWVGRDGSGSNTGGFSLIGSVPTIFSSNGVGNGFAPATDYVIGPDTYKMFPNFAVLKVV